MPTFNLDRLLECEAEKTREIISVMISPVDRNLGDQFIITNFFQGLDKIFIKDYGKHASLPYYFIEWPSRGDICQSAAVAMKKGIIAGMLVYFMFWMNLTSKKLSINKSIAMLQSICRSDKAFDIGLGRTKIFKYWDEFKSVSHLWCSVKIWAEMHPEDREQWWDGKYLDYVIAISEQLRDFIEQTDIGTAKTFTPIVPGSETWKVPQQFPLPNIPTLSLNRELPHLEEAYRATRKSKRK